MLFPGGFPNSLHLPSKLASRLCLTPHPFVGSRAALALCLLIPALLADVPHASAQQAWVGEPLYSPHWPTGVALDRNGNVYFADYTNYGQVEELSPGCASLQANCASTDFYNIAEPVGVAVDSHGNIYEVGNSYGLYEIPAGCTAADQQNATCKVTELGGPPHLIETAYGLAIDAADNIYVGYTGKNEVVELTPGCASSSCLTVIGSGFNQPYGVAVDSAGNVYVADFGNNAVKEIPPGCANGACTVTTLGGGFNQPTGVAVDTRGNVFVVDSGNNAVKIIPPGCTSAGCVSTLDGGFNLSTSFLPSGIAVDSSGNVYIGDTNNNSVREIRSQAFDAGSVAVNSATPATLTIPFTFYSQGSISAPKVVTQGAAGQDFTDAGTGSCTSGSGWQPAQTCFVNVIFSPKAPGLRNGSVELKNSSGAIIAAASIYGTGTGPQAVFIPAAIGALGGGFNNPFGVAVDSSGNAYVADYTNSAVRKIPVGCVSSTCVVALPAAFNLNAEPNPWGIAVDGSGNVFVADGQDLAYEIHSGCSAPSACVTALPGSFNRPQGIAIDAGGNVYVADTYDNAVKEIPAGCVLSTCVATLGGGFVGPSGVAVDAAGDIYVVDSNDAVQEMPPGCASSTCVTIVAGGPTVSQFSDPLGVAIGGNGNLYIADTDNSAVKEVYRAAPPPLSFDSTVAGSTSADSPQTVTVQNIGNGGLNISGVSYPTDFPEAPGVDTDCNASTQLEAAQSCTLTIDFSPLLSSLKSSSTQLSESIALTDNNLNQSSAKQSVAVHGSGTVSAAALTSPTPSSVLSGSVVAFKWSAAPGATGYRLWIGTSKRAYNLYTSGPITTASSTSANLPLNGEKLYVTLVTAYGSIWVYSDSVFTAATASALTSPAPNSVLAGSRVTFAWNASPAATAYRLWIGTSARQDNLYTSGPITATSTTPANLPTNGEKLYVTLVTANGSNWVYNDYVFTAATAAALTSPTPGSVLAGPEVRFTWSAAPAATAYRLWIGTSARQDDVYTSGPIAATSATPGLPTNGEKLYVTLVTADGSNWLYKDYVYTAATAAALTSPTPGTALAGPKVTFTWNASPGATAYRLWIGTSARQADVYTSGPITATSATPISLPTNGEKLYVTLVTANGSSWVFADYVFTAAP